MPEEFLGHPSSVCPRCSSELNLYLIHETIKYIDSTRGYNVYEIRCQSCDFKMKEDDGRFEDRMYEDQHINCQEKPCGQAPLGCTDKRYCPKE